MGDAAYKLDHIKRGLCRDCSGKAVAGSRFCQLHREQYRLRRQYQIQTRLRAGLCRDCGKPLNDYDAPVTCINCAAGLRRIR
jgi:hypothetical protein